MAQSSAQSGMDIQDQRETFHGFLGASLWIGSHIAQWVMLLTLSFAIGDGFPLRIGFYGARHSCGSTKRKASAGICLTPAVMAQL